MRYLFFFIHPAKYHAFRNTINSLVSKGHDVDILIISKDIVEELVREEGWPYTNIFPEGRRIRYLHTYLSAGINLVRTIYRLLKYTRGKQYDLFITDDLLTFVGRLKGIPTFFFTDDDLTAVPESVILVASTTHVLAPSMCNMAKYESKKIGYWGYKSLAHLHPNHFVPDPSPLPSHLLDDEKPYFFIRCVSATSTHDVGKAGLDDETLRQLITLLEPYGTVVLNAERELPEDLRKHVLDFKKADISHYIYFARLFISDSTTMCAESAVLGTPAIEFDDWHADFKQYEELNGKYALLFGFFPTEAPAMLDKVKELLEAPYDLHEEFQRRRRKMLAEKIDVSSFMTWLFEHYPDSVAEFRKDPACQQRFCIRRAV